MVWMGDWSDEFLLDGRMDVLLNNLNLQSGSLRDSKSPLKVDFSFGDWGT